MEHSKFFITSKHLFYCCTYYSQNHMKSLFMVFLIVVMSAFTNLQKTYAMDPKMKVMLESSGYGAAGGALLGTATLAFDGEARNIFKGASLGLYAGILFGAYVLTSYEMKKRGWGEEETEEYYPDEGPYENQPQGHYFPSPSNQIFEDVKTNDRIIFAMNFFNWKF